MKTLSINKKAKFEFEKIKTYTAGIVLTGPEVKSIKLNNFNLKDSYCKFINNELFTTFHISEYKNKDIQKSHDPKRNKKLLLNRKELNKLEKSINEKGLTIVPFKVYLDKSLIKVEIWLARGKKLYDKRETLKKEDSKRELNKRYIN